MRAVVRFLDDLFESAFGLKEAGFVGDHVSDCCKNASENCCVEEGGAAGCDFEFGEFLVDDGKEG